MTFTFKVYYEDDSLLNYSKERSKLVRAKNKEQAMERCELYEPGNFCERYN